MGEMEKSEVKSGWTSLIDVDRRYLQILVFIITAYILAQPLGLPMKISTLTQDAYNAIEALPEDAFVVVFQECSIALWNDFESQTIVVLRHLFKKPIRVVIVAGTPDGIVITNNIIEDWLDTREEEYGKDYVFLGYIAGGPGGETVKAALAEDMFSLVETDAYGNDLRSMPIFEDIGTAADWDMVLCTITGGGGSGAIMRQIQGVYGTPYVAISGSGAAVGVMIWIESGQMLAQIPGMKGGAEYESISGMPGLGMSRSEAVSVLFLTTVVLIILGNIISLIQRTKGGQR